VTAANTLRKVLSAGDTVAVFGTTDASWVSGMQRAQGAEDGAPGARPPAGENGAARALPRRAANRPADARPRPAGPPPRRLQSADFALAIGIGLAAGVMAAFFFSRREP